MFPEAALTRVRAWNLTSRPAGCENSSVLELPLVNAEGVRYVPDVASGVGALVLAGSSGRVDTARAQLLAQHGVLAESMRWFGGEGQHDGPWEIPLELFFDRVNDLRRHSDRVVVIGTSFGSEAALLIGALSNQVDAVVAFAPSDVVWAGITREGRVTSHWTSDGKALPFVPFADGWQPDIDPPAFVGLYERSRRQFAYDVAAAAIPVEDIARLVLVAGGDDQVWPSVPQAQAIRDRRADHGLSTELVIDPQAGHRTILPGEPIVTGGMRMQRGGTEPADKRLGQAAWAHLSSLLGHEAGP